MDWTRGYSTEWEVTRVDPDTWADSGTVEGVMSVSVARDGTDSVPLLESGTMELDGESPFEWSWCRVWATVAQGAPERFAVATLLFERGSERVDHGRPKSKLSGKSVLQPAADEKMPVGGFAPAGGDGAAFAASLLSGCIPAPVEVEGSFTLTDDVVFDVGATVLSAAWAVLNAAGWCMQIEGDGTVGIRAKPTEPSLELDRAHAGLLLPGVDRTLDLSGVPNRYFAVRGSQTEVAVNDDPDLLASRPKRGRWVDVVDTSPTLVDGEPLLSYARRKLAEASTVTREFSYEREYWPGVHPFSLVRASLPAHGVEGDLRVLSQTLECGKGVKVSEKAGQEVRV